MTDTDKTDIEKLRAELARILATGIDDSGVWWLRATIDLYERVKVLETRQQTDRVLIACLEEHVEALENAPTPPPQILDRIVSFEKRIAALESTLTGAGKSPFPAKDEVDRRQRVAFYRNRMAELEEEAKKLRLVEPVKDRESCFDDNCASMVPEKCQECAIGENDLSVETLEKLPPSSLALRVVALTLSHDTMKKMWRNEKAKLADLKVRVAQFANWARTTMGWDEYYMGDKFHELRLDEKE